MRHRTHLGKKMGINGRGVVCVNGSKRVQRTGSEQQSQQLSETASAVDEREDGSNFTSASAARLTQHRWRSSRSCGAAPDYELRKQTTAPDRAMSLYSPSQLGRSTIPSQCPTI